MALSSQRRVAPSFNSLPSELQQDIFCYLDGDNASLFAVVRVSKAYHNLCIDRLWRNSNKPETLVELDLTIVETDEGDDHDKILQVVGCLSSLVRLSILFDFDSVVSRTSMDHISDLSKLQKCHIESRGSSFPMEDEFRSSRHSWITDRYFKDWSAKLPRLRDLRLALDASAFTSVTHSCLQSLADNCPLLVNCQLIWEHDLSTWRSLEGPLFPCLEILHLGQVKNYGLEREQAALDKVALKNVEIIQNLAPKLNELHVESTRLNEKALMAIFKAGI